MRKKQINNPQITIFISWSGNYSKIIAEELKRVIEQDVFAKENVRCFVSTMDIASGEDWYNKIKNELRKSKLGIICITKENVKAPWLYFEAGALVGHNMRVVPLLVNCDQRSLEHTPIQSNQSIQFYTTERFLKMLDDIRAMFGFLGELKEEERENRYHRAYDKMKQNLKPILEEMKGKRYFSERYIYPPEIHTMTMDTVYISAPMSTLSDGEYKEQQAFLRQLSQELLNSKRFKKVYYQCKFKSMNRISDITLADFWGIEYIAPDMNDDKGTSLVLLNTPKGKIIFEAIHDRLITKEVDYEEAAKNNAAIIQSAPKPAERERFIHDTLEYGFPYVRKKYLTDSPMLILKTRIKKILGHLYNSQI